MYKNTEKHTKNNIVVILRCAGPCHLVSSRDLSHVRTKYTEREASYYLNAKQNGQVYDLLDGNDRDMTFDHGLTYRL